MSLLNRIPPIVQQQLLDANSLVPVETCSGGLSGAGVVRCVDSKGQQYCLRQWASEHPTRERLRLIHFGMQVVAAQYDFVPRLIPLETGATAFYVGERAWELTTWLDGHADYLENPTPARLEAAVTAVAKVHNCWADASETPLLPRVGPSPAMLQRQQRLQWWLLNSELRQRVATSLQELTDDKRAWFSKLALQSIDMLAAIGHDVLRAVTALVADPVVQHFVMRDLWSEHVLFDGDTVTGLIDFGAARIDESAADVARLLGSLEPTSSEARERATKRYFDAIGHTMGRDAEERFLERVQTLDRANCLLSALQWLEWTVLQPRSFHASDAFIANRWETFLDRL